jgi:hypothetical protein
VADQDDYYGEFQAIAPLIVLTGYLKESGFDKGRLTFVLPNDVLPEITQAYGFPIVRADVPAPLIGVAPDPPEAQRG